MRPRWAALRGGHHPRTELTLGLTAEPLQGPEWDHQTILFPAQNHLTRSLQTHVHPRANSNRPGASRCTCPPR